ncbi:MAG: PDZ domain-containing protein [Terriglobia bacterium]|jgi:membrane-associated protease RseP (regulator of RpoE activity)|nr:PDZ domain-containing protein [Terriglobia bacterium]
MKKGLIAGCLLVLMSGVPAVFAADNNCPADPQFPGEYQEHKSKTSYLGVEVNDVDADRAKALSLKEETGVEVLGVDQDAPAGKAGIKEHDVILAVNGTKIESEEELRRVIRETPPGRTIDLLVSRNGQQLTLKPTLAARDQMTAMWVAPRIPQVHVEPHIAPMPPMPPMSFETPDVPDVRVYYNLRSVGAYVENLTPQLRDFFGVKNGAGILVRSVERGSPAAVGGLKAGDVIVRVGQETVNDSGDWRRALRNKSGNVPVGIVRDKREQNLTIKLPERRQTGETWDNESFDFDLQPQMEALRKELQSMPKINEEQKMAMLKAQQEWKKEFENNRAEWQKSIAEAQKETSKEQQKAMKDLQKNLEKMQKNLQKQFHYISYE